MSVRFVHDTWDLSFQNKHKRNPISTSCSWIIIPNCILAISGCHTYAIYIHTREIKMSLKFYLFIIRDV
jgi:hypothetical protein